MKRVKPADREFFASWKPLTKFVSCEYSFANLVIWGELYDICWKEERGIPVIYIGRDKCLMFPHIPALTETELYSMLRKTSCNEPGAAVSQVPPEWMAGASDLSQFFEPEENLDFTDYIHSVDRLRELSGRKLRKKRNLIVQFETAFPDYRVERLNAGHFKDCLDMARSQTDSIGEKNEELSAMRRAFSLYNELYLDGLTVYASGKLAAFAVFSRHIDSSYVVHFEKNDTSFKGAAQFINQRTAEYLSGKTDYINREQDLGIPGLRKAKKSYDPDTLLVNFKLNPLSLIAEG
jgi:hypothetical protein